jgi:hypothetical protein
MATDGRVISLTYTPAMINFMRCAATGVGPDGGHYDEVAVVSPRGEGKTWGVLGAQLLHAQEHEQRGFPLPVPWLWFRDSFPNHERNLLEDLDRIEWGGLWRKYDGGRTVQAEMAGQAILKAFVFGLEDVTAIERLRGGCVGVYGEEPAPAIGLGVGTGWTESAWALALSSQGRGDARSHYQPAIIASNYPQKSHWFWKRFFAERQPQCLGFRVQSGDRTTPEYRARLGRALANQPAMLTRLFKGEPAPPQLGDPVILGYKESIHLTYKPVPVAPGPLYLGWDAWHHPAAVVSSLSAMGQLRIHFAKRMDRADIGMIAGEAVKPWLIEHGLLDRARVHIGDPSMEAKDQSDRAQCAQRRLLQILPGEWHAGTNDITVLQTAVTDALTRNLSTGEPTILIGPEAQELDESWSGGWHVDERGKPVQHGEQGQYSHVGMAGAYLVHGVFGSPTLTMDVDRWATQPAYTQPWNGQRGPSPSPAVVAVQQRTFSRAVWLKQYE